MKFVNIRLELENGNFKERTSGKRERKRKKKQRKKNIFITLANVPLLLVLSFVPHGPGPGDEVWREIKGYEMPWNVMIKSCGWVAR